MKYRVLCDFRVGKEKYKKGKVYEIGESQVEELLEAKLITEYKDENIVFKETALIESLRAEKIVDSETIKKQQEEIQNQKKEIEELKNEKSQAPSKEINEIVEYLLQVENLEKMEVMLIEGIGEKLGLEVTGANKKEKAKSLYDQVTKE